MFMGVLIVRSTCHECLAAPSVGVSDEASNPIDVQVESNQIHGYIKGRQFAGCYFYWHESNRGGN